jgi:NADH dehydrogenase/NADH:ubiquinone oxidoreductase subunit G
LCIRQIIRALSELNGVTLPYNTIEEVREQLIQQNPLFNTIDELNTNNSKFDYSNSKIITNNTIKPYGYYYDNYFLTNPISRASVIMAKCLTQLPTANNSYIKQ